MIGRVKNWLGIEGVKLELDIPEQVQGTEGQVQGKIYFQSMRPQTVTEMQIKFIERYARGRGKDKMIDDYELGATKVVRTIEVPAEERLYVDFTLPFRLVNSDMDELQRRNFLTRGFVKAAKYLNKVESIYRVEAEAKVRGTALNPFARKEIKIL